MHDGLSNQPWDPQGAQTLVYPLLMPPQGQRSTWHMPSPVPLGRLGVLFPRGAQGQGHPTPVEATHRPPSKTPQSRHFCSHHGDVHLLLRCPSLRNLLSEHMSRPNSNPLSIPACPQPTQGFCSMPSLEQRAWSGVLGTEVPVGSPVCLVGACLHKCNLCCTPASRTF